MYRFHYTDKEINEILKTMVIVADTREQKNEHILDYLKKKNVPVVSQKLDFGDYSALIPRNDELGITRNIYLNSVVERKANVDELCGNLQKTTQQAFENELIRSQQGNFVLMVEQLDFYTKLIHGDYRSQYDPKALLARLKSFEAKYNFNIVPVQKKEAGNWIYYRFYYEARNLLKQGAF
ncbi:ERCC4 domain-containing protein [Solibacillus sp. FSL W7-1436]|uniref:ERCC4 domain-containing protein n=1 Tax=Solibacillus sp. FSL W7-1436 TaxID=2921705 RepID=UPI0030F4F0AD